MLACCAFAIILIAPFFAGWRRARVWLHRVAGLSLPPDNAAVAWQPGMATVPGARTPHQPHPSRLTRPSRVSRAAGPAVWLAFAIAIAIAIAAAAAVHAWHGPFAPSAAFGGPLDFICRPLP